MSAFKGVGTGGYGSTVRTTTLNVDYPGGIVAGDFLLAFLTASFKSPNGTLTAPSGWTLLKSQLDQAGGDTAFVYYKIADGTESGSSTWTWSVSHAVLTGIIGCWDGNQLEGTLSNIGYNEDNSGVSGIAHNHVLEEQTNTLVNPLCIMLIFAATANDWDFTTGEPAVDSFTITPASGEDVMELTSFDVCTGALSPQAGDFARDSHVYMGEFYGDGGADVPDVTWSDSLGASLWVSWMVYSGYAEVPPLQLPALHVHPQRVFIRELPYFIADRELFGERSD